MAKRAAACSDRGAIRTGIGGWVYPPWRETFHPSDLKQADELAYAVSKLGAIEIIATFYRTQTAASFAKWRDAAPPSAPTLPRRHPRSSDSCTPAWPNSGSARSCGSSRPPGRSTPASCRASSTCCRRPSTATRCAT